VSAENYREYIGAVREYLRKEKATSSQHTRSNKAIVGALKTRFREIFAESTLFNYLNYAAKKDNKSGIISEGPRRGYWFDESAVRTAQQVESEQEEEETAERRVRLRREAVLYRPVCEWLQDEGYKAQDVADVRGGPKWSNPDVVGIRVTKNYGLIDIELVSIEVKLVPANWRTDIFEAIAHKRFANRVYFCYPVTEGLDKLDEDIARYSELYRVGILQVYLDKKTFSSLIDSRRKTDLPQIGVSQIDLMDVKIPAPYDFVPPRYQIEFIEALGIKDEAQLWAYGKTTR
jgi:hypothetical protein